MTVASSDRLKPPEHRSPAWRTDDSLAFCETLLRDTGVATAPGIDFDPVDAQHFIRISFAVCTAETRDAIVAHVQRRVHLALGRRAGHRLFRNDAGTNLLRRMSGQSIFKGRP